MTRRPARDEREIVPNDLPKRGGGERVWIAELATYLNHSIRTLRSMARAHGWLHHSTVAPTRNRVYWVTPYAAGRLIAFARAMQGQSYMAGTDWHEWRRKMLEESRLDKRRRSAKVRGKFTLAIYGAGTEDESRERSGRQTTSESLETAVVSVQNR
jgi:hypothetical protein